MPEKILIVDDTPANMAMLLDFLEPRGYIVSAAPNGLVALNVLPRLEPDLILLDVMMPELDGLEVCRRIKANPVTAHVPVLLVSARDDSESILAGFAAGAADYIVKPFVPDEVRARVQCHLGLARMARELRQQHNELTAAYEKLQTEGERRRQTEDALSSADAKLTLLAENETQKWGVKQFVGKSPTIGRIVDSIRRLQNFGSVNVVISGESGTGKELVARAIHYGSTRAKGPFVPINCVAIPDELAESMLFGHLKGSFTGATMDRKGYFELADGGTLFLDEIGDMPLALQAKLLRVLEDGLVTPIGATTARQVDVRIVAATNADLPAQIAAGAFRRDLYFRLAQFTVDVPPLRQRREDIPLLARHFLHLFATEMGLRPPALAAETLAALTRHDYPGNIRELKNIMERSLIESGGEDVRPEHLHLAQPAAAPQPAQASSGFEDHADPLMELPLNLEQVEGLLIQRALAQTEGNIAKAARLLGVNRTRIYRKFQEGQAVAAADA